MARLLVLALVLIASVARAQSPSVLEFKGICDASAAVALDENLIIVGDDEKPWLSIYRLDTQQLEMTIPLAAFGIGAAIGADEDPPEADIEAATVLDGRIVWITSHGRNKNGKVRPDRFQLFASHRLNPDGAAWDQLASSSFQGLPKAITKTSESAYAPMRKAIGDLDKTDKKLAPKKDGFNIEAMSATGDGKAFLVGLRNPQRNGQAILFRIDNAAALVDGDETKASLGLVMTLDLGGRGFRDIAWSPAHRAYLIVAGQADDDDRGPGFALFRWRGTGKAEPVTAFGHVNADHRDFHPEAIVPLKERNQGRLVASKKVLLISDDGRKPIPGLGDCKAQVTANRSFRGVIQRID